jgi:hypothetical protein
MTEPLNFIYQSTARGHLRQMNAAERIKREGRQWTIYYNVEFQMTLIGADLKQVWSSVVSMVNTVDWIAIGKAALDVQKALGSVYQKARKK